MKKLVVVTTAILIALLAVLGVIVVRERLGTDSGEKTALSDLKESLNLGKDETEAEDETQAGEQDYYYEGDLLKFNVQQEVITYEGRDFEVKFANPFYDAASPYCVEVIFYDETHGYLLKSLGAGTDSEFFEAYRTEDGCESWTKCAGDIWFDLDGENHLSMISENELVYVHTVTNPTIGIKQTEISYSPDFGNTWYEYEGGMQDEGSEEILAALSEMTLEEKVAQMFIISPEALTGYETVYNAGDSTYGALEEYPVGGLVYTADNMESDVQLQTMLANVQDFGEELTGWPLFLAIAEEGGTCSAIGGNEWLESSPEAADSASTIGNSGDTAKAREAGKYIGGLLDDYGFNMNLAPVADVLAGNSYQMSQRIFSMDAQTVSDMALAFAEGQASEEVHSVMKYFPGYGAASSAATGYPVINSTLEEMKSKEFLPYINAIEQGLDFIMVGHIAVPNVTGDQTPASLSEVMISEVLRDELGYRGVVITDYLNADEIQAEYTSAQAAVKAIQAGADMLLAPADFEAAYEGVLDAVHDGTITEERIDESLYRILSIKAADRET